MNMHAAEIHGCFTVHVAVLKGSPAALTVASSRMFVQNEFFPALHPELFCYQHAWWPLLTTLRVTTKRSADSHCEILH
jgi:hypothetical protein